MAVPVFSEKVTQKILTKHVHNAIFNKLMLSVGLGKADKSRIRDQTTSNSSAWMNITITNSISSYRFSKILLRHVGANITGQVVQNGRLGDWINGEFIERILRCARLKGNGRICGAVLDNRLRHSTERCKSMLMARHDALKRALAVIVRRAGMGGDMEVDVFPERRDGLRPADVVIECGDGIVAVDISIVSCVGEAAKHLGDKVAGHNVRKREEAKIALY